MSRLGKTHSRFWASYGSLHALAPIVPYAQKIKKLGSTVYAHVVAVASPSLLSLKAKSLLDPPISGVSLCLRISIRL